MTLSELLKGTDFDGILEHYKGDRRDTRLGTLHGRLLRAQPRSAERELILTVMEFDGKSPCNPGKVMDVSAYDVRENYFYSLSLMDFDTWLSLPVHALSLRRYGEAPAAAAILREMRERGIGFRGDSAWELLPVADDARDMDDARTGGEEVCRRAREACRAIGAPDPLEYKAEMDRRNDRVQEEFAAHYRPLSLRQASGCSFVRGMFLADEKEE